MATIRSLSKGSPMGQDLKLSFPYNKQIIDIIKSLPFKKQWDPGAKSWVVPLAARNKVSDLLSKQGFQFELSDPVLTMSDGSTSVFKMDSDSSQDKGLLIRKFFYAERIFVKHISAVSALF